MRFSVIMEGRRQFHEAAEDDLVKLAWYGAAFQRMRKLPGLDTVLRAGEPLEPQQPADMLAVMQSIQALGGDVSIELVDEKDL